VVANIEIVRGDDVNTLTTLQPKNQSGETTATAREVSRPAGERSSYHELPGLHHETRDVLKQLDANINLLDDLSGRLSFVLNEVRTMVRR
jgi:hypothetical protein